MTDILASLSLKETAQEHAKKEKETIIDYHEKVGGKTYHKLNEVCPSE